REEHPSASVPVILRTLVAEGRLEPDAISASSVRRFYQEKGLDRVAVRNQARGKVRLRWQAERPGALWHADVCHGTAVVCDARSLPVRIHGILDDASRYVIALEAFHHERESEMLTLLVRAVRKHGPADALYLDNGPTYRGQALSLACARMGTTLIHAKPYDAPARGKMERFWRTLREGCLDHTGSLGSLHDLNVRLWAFIDQHYHRAPHGGLLGKSPQSVYEATPRPVDGFDEEKLRKRSPFTRAAACDATAPCRWMAPTGKPTCTSSPASSSPSPAVSSTRASLRGSSTKAEPTCFIPSTRRKTQPVRGLHLASMHRIRLVRPLTPPRRCSTAPSARSAPPKEKTHDLLQRPLRFHCRALLERRRRQQALVATQQEEPRQRSRRVRPGAQACRRHR